MMARVRARDAPRSTASGSRARVSGSTSTKTGVAPAITMVELEATKEKAGVMTSSPGPTPSGGQGHPQGVGPGGHADGVADAAAARPPRPPAPRPPAPGRTGVESSTRSMARSSSGLQRRVLPGQVDEAESSERPEARAEAADAQEVQGEAELVVALVARDVLERSGPSTGT